MAPQPDYAHTTVTGVFPNRKLAFVAARRLMSAGFRPEQVDVVHGDTATRHEFIDEHTNDSKRATILGAMFGAAGGALAGAALSASFGLTQSVALGSLSAAVGGTVLGLLIGRSTKSQIQGELEHQADAGAVLVSVTTDSAHGRVLRELFAIEGGTSMVSTPATFTAGILPPTPN